MPVVFYAPGSRAFWRACWQAYAAELDRVYGPGHEAMHADLAKALADTLVDAAGAESHNEGPIGD